MKKNKWYTISVFIIMCVLLNLAGKCVAGQLRLPLWLDSLGTVAATYVCGPVCGVIVGVTLNILYSIIYSWTYACYAIVSVSIAVIAGICISKDYMKTLLGALTSSFYIALVSCVISMIFNYMFFNGYTNNIWGDGVVESLLGIGFNDLLSHIAGQFYIDFPDKIITVLALYIFVRYDKGKNRFDKRIMTVCIYIGIAAMAAVQLIEAGTSKCVYAASDNIRNNQNNIEETPDYNTYLQTVYGRENGIPGGRANDIAQTNDGILWIGTYGGLYRYNGTEFKWVDEYASVKTVNCLYKDEEGRLWIGTNDGGVSIMIDETIINVVSEKEGLSADSVKCITQGSDGDYYIGTTGAMSVVSLAGGLTVKSYIDDIKYAVSADSDKNGNIAVVSDNGQLSIVKNAAVISEYSASDGGRYTTCSFDDAGMLYVGTSKGNIDKYEYIELYKSIGKLKQSIVDKINNYTISNIPPKIIMFKENQEIIKKDEALLLGYLHNIGFDVIVFIPSANDGFMDVLSENIYSELKLPQINNKVNKNYIEKLGELLRGRALVDEDIVAGLTNFKYDSSIEDYKKLLKKSDAIFKKMEKKLFS